jgi:HEAT repeat protein
MRGGTLPDTDEQQIRELLRPTHDDGWPERVSSLNPETAIPVLARILSNEGTTTGDRRSAVLILGRLRDRRAIGPLEDALDAPDHAVRGRALLGLAALGSLDEGLLDRVTEALGDRDEFVRESAARALASLGRREALHELARVAEADDSESVREAARQAVVEIEGGQP